MRNREAQACPFDLAAVRRELDGESWTEDHEDRHQEVRRIYLGSIFTLTPSGKMYMPFACGNVEPCPECKGRCTSEPHRKRRVVKRWEKRHARTMQKFDRLFGATPEPGMPSLGADYQPPGRAAAYRFIRRQPRKFRLRGSIPRPSCNACGGLGSREAYLDELFNEALEEHFQKAGIGLSWEDGDCFAVDYREKPEAEESEDDGDDSDVARDCAVP